MSLLTVGKVSHLNRSGLISYLLIPLAILGLNLFLVYPLFQGEYTRWFVSIESVFLADAQFIVDNFPRISWYPFWYNGFPFHLAYQPIVPFALAFLHWLSGLSIPFLYRVLSGALYALTPVFLYFLVNSLARSTLAGTASALVYSLAPSVAYLIPGTWIGLGLVPWHAVVATIYGEGPHSWALALVPLAILAFIGLFKTPSRGYLAVAVVLSAAILLTSLTAFLAYGVFIGVIYFAELLVGRATAKTVALFLTFGLALALSAFWYNPSFIRAALAYSEAEGGGALTGLYRNPFAAFLVLAPTIAITSVLLRKAFRNYRDAYLWFVGVAPFVILFASIGAWYVFNIALVPLPFRSIPRFIPELELAFAIMVGIGVGTLARHPNLSRGAKYGLLGVFFLSLGIASNDFRAIQRLMEPVSNLAEFPEYKISRWLEGQAQGERTYATGTTAFWLNVFSKVPQLRGGKGGDFGGLNPWWSHISYQLYYGEDGELAVNWLKALGYRFIVVNFPDSKVAVNDYRHPEKFEGKLKRVYENRGDVVYEVPLRQDSLALAVDLAKMDQVPEVENLSTGEIVLDKERLRRYLEATELGTGSKSLRYSYSRPWDRVVIEADELPEGYGVLVRISYDPGWRAFQGKQEVKITKDPIGFMLIQPQAGEAGDIRLEYSPLGHFALGLAVTAVAIAVFVALLLGRL